MPAIDRRLDGVVTRAYNREHGEAIVHVTVMSQSAHERLFEEMAAVEAEILAAHEASLCTDTATDPRGAACQDMSEAIMTLTELLAIDGLRPAEIRTLCNWLQKHLAQEHALLKQGVLLRQATRATIARSARQIEAAQALIDQLTTDGRSQCS
jgi:hypothetical protein